MLYIFDIDGTLIRSFMREGAREDYDKVEVLAGRAAVLRELADGRHHFALATNQGGVAFGYQTVEQVWRKVGAVAAAFDGFYGAPTSFHVCFHHPKAKLVEWSDPDGCARRKPSGLMLVEAESAHDMDAVFVGDMDTDRRAAWDVGISYFDATEFFGS